MRSKILGGNYDTTRRMAVESEQNSRCRMSSGAWHRREFVVARTVKVCCRHAGVYAW